MVDRAEVRGVKRGRPNRKRRGSSSMFSNVGSSIITRASISPALVRIAFVATGVAATVAGVHYGHRFLKTSPELAVASIDVQGTKRATKDSIVRLSGVQIGQNIFDVSVAEIERNVSAHPWVARANVRREYPSSIRIEVSEHEPAVLVALGHLYYANESGEIVKRYTPGENEELPVITGLTRSEMETDDGDAKLRLRSAIAFLGELREVLGKDAPRVAEIHLDAALGLSFTVSGDDTAVLLGSPPWKQRIDRLLTVKDALEKRGVHASKIMMGGERRPDRAVARLEGAQETHGELLPAEADRSCSQYATETSDPGRGGWEGSMHRAERVSLE
jgi:cell division protein FtsQ